jgi:hypothetical protein
MIILNDFVLVFLGRVTPQHDFLSGGWLEATSMRRIRVLLD